MKPLADQQQAEIDARILAGDILVAIRLTMAARGVGLAEARDINRARYQQLRAERGTEFACGDQEYWSGYAECIGEAIDKGL
jgi:hypothetical protein